MRRFLTFTSATLAIAGTLGAGMTYDGSYYLYRTLEDGYPFIPNRRMIHGLLQLLPLTLSRLTDDIGVLQASFGVIYAGMTVIALFAAWWIVKDRARHLFVWAAFGIGIATLPGQIAYISEGAMVLQWAWALFLAVLLGIRRRDLPLLVVFSGLIFITHPTAFLLFGITALLSLITAMRRRVRGWLLWTGMWMALAVVAALNFVVNANPYEITQLWIPALLASFFSSAVGLQLVALVMVWLAGLMLIRPLLPKSLLRYIPKLPVRRLLRIALFSMVIWALVPIFWIDALSYRFFVIPFSAPFIIFAAFDALRSELTAKPPDWSERLNIIQTVGVIFTLTLGIQVLFFFGFVQGLRATLAASPAACLSMDDPNAKWLRYTILNHWTSVSFSIILQGRQPEKIFLRNTSCTSIDFSEGVPIASWDLRQWSGGWFDLRKIQNDIGAENNVP